LISFNKTYFCDLLNYGLNSYIIVMVMYDVIIVGAGIAGLTAAIYAARQNLKTLVISLDLGGQLLLASELQNFPGFKKIKGFELIRRVEEQARLYGADFVFDKVVAVKEEKGKFKVKTTMGEYESLALILAFGKTPKEMNIPGEEEFKGRGISYCTICDAPLFKGRVVALVGWGEAGLEGALILKDIVQKLYWIFPGAQPIKDQNMLNFILGSGKVELVPFSEPIEAKGEKKIEYLVVKNKKTGEIKELKVDGVFVEMGYVTETDFVKGFVELNEKGEIVTDKLGRTSRKGVFAAGDVTDTLFKQAVISAGQGATAALSAYNYIMKIKGKKTEIVADWKHVKLPTEEEEKKKVFS